MSALGMLTRRISSLSISKSVTAKTTWAATTSQIPRASSIISTSSFSNGGLVLPYKFSPTATHFSGLRFQSTTSGGNDDKKSSSGEHNNNNNNNDNNNENDDWVDFQKSIQVRGFDTGQQTVKHKSHQGGGGVGKKVRGGKLARTRKERIRQQRRTDSGVEDAGAVALGGGHFPALRYSDEETERLLAEAYAGIPKRDGKRGTNNLKRQRVRHRKKRAYHAKKKREIVRAHYARTAKIAEKYRQIRQARFDAVDTRRREQAYQQEVLRRSLNNRAAHAERSEDDTGSEEVVEGQLVMKHKN